MVLGAVVALSAAPALAVQTSSALPPIRYILSFPAPATHYVEVEAQVPTEGRDQVDLFMAVWTPGSYMLREYASEVEGMRAFAGARELRVEKTRKNRWRVESGGATSITLRYRVYAAVVSVRYDWVDRDFAMLNGAPTFVSLVEPGARRPHEVSLELPPAWAGAWTPLTRLEPGRAVFRADDYDTLVDSPIVAGSPVVREFVVDGKPHLLVIAGDARFFDADRAAADVQRIVEASKGLMGSLPYSRYHFFNVIADGGDGLEHAEAFVVTTGRFTTRTRESYVGWLSLVAHEFFHAWNVKRLRPVQLGPFDYEGENYVPTLWAAEGFTDYYADVLLARAGLATRDEYLSSLSRAIAGVQETPGRAVTPLAQASFDAWIKQYRPNENTVNTTVDYYAKGAVVAFLLDARIRSLTSGARSLDDVMRLAMARYSGARGYTPSELYATASEVAGRDLVPWFHSTVESTEELEYGEALAYFGLRFRPEEPAAKAHASLGADTRVEDGRIVITQVRRGEPAYEAGLSAGDEILALDEVRVAGGALPARLESYRPGDSVVVLYARKERVQSVRLTLGAATHPWILQTDPAAGDVQHRRLDAWLGKR